MEYRNGNTSNARFLERPDFGATFPDPNPFNPGGWIYTINSEAKNTGSGGVGAFAFDSSGEIVSTPSRRVDLCGFDTFCSLQLSLRCVSVQIKYEMVLRGTTMNCGGLSIPLAINHCILCLERMHVSQGPLFDC